MIKSRKIVLLGVGPIPPQSPKKIYATGLYLWALAELLQSAGHSILLGVGTFGEDDIHQTPLYLIEFSRQVKVLDLPLDPHRAAARLNEELKTFNPDAVIATTDVMINAACRLDVSCPRFFFFNGQPMTERQMQAGIHKSDLGLLDQWLMILPALLGGDKFATVSTYQKYCLLGELGTIGRLNQYVINYPFVDVLPTCVFEQPTAGRKGQIKGQIVPENAFIVLWLGGYNTWSDEETLFAALETAMEKDPSIHFVSTGGEIKGHNEITFERFVERIHQSRFANRYHLVGWVEWGDLGKYYADADCGLCVDLPTLEGIFGARNRIVQLLYHGLPVFTNSQDEATGELVKMGFVFPFSSKSSEDLAQSLLECSRNRDKFIEKAKLGSQYIKANWIPEKRWASLLQWVDESVHAPDLKAPIQEVFKDVKGCSLDYTVSIPDNNLARMHVQFLNEALSKPRDIKMDGKLKKVMKRLWPI